MDLAGPETNGPWRALARFLVDGGSVPEPTLLASHGLEALAYLRVDPSHPEHARWRTAYLRRVATHLAIRSELVPLVQAWRADGIDVLLFKGFYLAEFQYPTPAERFYKDVDILVPEGAAGRARQIAVDLGWSVPASRTGATSTNLNSHMDAILRRGLVSIDLHRFVVHGGDRDERVPRRYTAAAWAASREVAWEGTTVRVLDPRDDALMGLVVGRAWSHDGWRLKATDYRDLHLLAERTGLTRDDLAARAAELGCTRTLELLLARCDPWRGYLDMRPPTPEQVRWWWRATAEERGRRRTLGFLRLPGLSAVGLAAALPGLMRARRLVRRHPDPETLVANVRSAARGGSTLDPEGRRRIFAGARFGAALVQPSGDRCLVRSVALYEALRARGEAVTLYLGADAAGRLHAWVRYDHRAAAHAETWRTCAAVQVTLARTSPAPEV
jgi:hypothetical protein